MHSSLHQHCTPLARARHPRPLRCRVAPRAASDSPEGESEGSPSVQEELVAILRKETTKLSNSEQVDIVAARETQNLIDMVDGAKLELDELGRCAGADSHRASLRSPSRRQNRERSDSEFASALSDVNAVADAFEAELRADREAAEASLEELAAWEKESTSAANSNLFFKQLYSAPGDTSRKPRKEAAAAEGGGPSLSERTTPSFLAQLSSPWRAAVYGSGAAALLSLASVEGEASPALSAITVLLATALGARVMQELRQPDKAE